MENIKYYNEKTKALTLVSKVKDPVKGDVETTTYQYPFFVEGIYTERAIQLGAELEEAGYFISEDLFNRLANFFVELYGKQFTVDELKRGIHSDFIVNTFVTMLFGVLQGRSEEKNE